MSAAMRRRVLDALFLHFSSERAPLIVHGLLMKSQCGRSCSRTCGRAPLELRKVFQERMFPAATPSTHSAVIISALKSLMIHTLAFEGETVARRTVVDGLASAAAPLEPEFIAG